MNNVYFEERIKYISGYEPTNQLAQVHSLVFFHINFDFKVYLLNIWLTMEDRAHLLKAPFIYLILIIVS